MEPTPAHLDQIVDSSKQFARRLLTVGENRLELLVVEIQEQRARLLHAMFLALAVAVFGFLALLSLNVAIVILLWERWPISALLVMCAVYSTGAYCCYRQLASLLRDWTLLSATLEQLRKDRECLEKNLA